MATIEQKAKAYDEAINRMKHYVVDEYGCSRIKVDDVFPELKESEDELHRKWILEYLYDGLRKSDEQFKDQFKCAIAWFEKQGEKKTIWHNEDEEPQRGSLILLIMQSGNPIVAKIIEPNHTFNHGERWAYIDDLLEKQGEQKSDEIRTTGYWNVQNIEQKPAWSEEDEKIRIAIFLFIESYGAHACYEVTQEEMLDWLKSLKERYSWKPSDEQMKILNEVLNFAANHESPHWNDYIFGTLNNLIRQLKKLREE